MARPRALGDEQVLDRIARALDSASASWTLAGAARSAGLHPATLIERFGSRHEVLLALSRRWIASIPKAATTAEPYDELQGRPMDISNKVIAITSASSGIGQATARELAG